MASSRLTPDGLGRIMVEVTQPGTELPLGARFVMLGNTFECCGVRIGWLGEQTGRVMTAAERKSQRFPYDASARRLKVSEPKPVDDDEFDEAAALEACRRG